VLQGLGASSAAWKDRSCSLGFAGRRVPPGEILFAPYADVGWSPLFLAARAVVTDLGGPLSHAAIVAREYGVPAVVNVKVGTRVIHTGDRLAVDGDAGTVQVIEPKRVSEPSAAE
jgi:pyruvate,water dikinase